MERSILAIIPARGGSKGIPHKNIRPFCGKPLIAYSIEAAKNAPSIHRSIVSTDSEEVAKVARECGAEVPFLRPQELATDSSSVVDAVIHLLGELQKKEGYVPTHVMLLQPTSPLRTSDDIEAAVALLSGAQSVVSVCKTENLLFTKDADSILQQLPAEPLESSNRQEQPTYYKLDGSMLYLIETPLLLAERSFLAGRLAGYEIARWRAIDLDEPQDFVLGELIYKNQETLKKQIETFS